MAPGPAIVTMVCLELSLLMGPHGGSRSPEEGGSEVSPLAVQPSSSQLLHMCRSALAQNTCACRRGAPPWAAGASSPASVGTAGREGSMKSRMQTDTIQKAALKHHILTQHAPQTVQSSCQHT